MSIKTISILFLVLIIFVSGFYFFSHQQRPSPSQNTETKPQKTCNFEIKEVYFEENPKDPDAPFLRIRGVIGPVGFYKYVIYFPPQEKTSFPIGPIEVGEDSLCQDCKPSNSCQEFITLDTIHRSYPFNVPEFGVKYFGKITLYLNDNTEKTWEGEVGWKKVEQGEKNR